MRLFLLVVSLAIFGLLALPARAADPETQVQQLDRRTLLELIKLAEFNVRYQQTVNNHARWRNFTYPLAQESAYGCFLGYSVTDLSQKSKGWNNPRLISKSAIRQGLSSALVGSCVGAGSSLFELAANEADTIRDNRMGCSPRQSALTFQAKIAKIDELLAERQHVMSDVTCTGTRRELLDLKEQLLKYERDRLIFEFRRWSAHSCGYSWYKNSFYVINASVNMIRLSAVVTGLKSFSNKDYGGAVGPQLMSSAVIAGLGPYLSTKFGDWRRHNREKALSKMLPAQPVFSDEEAKAKFDRLAVLLADTETSRQHTPLLSELVRLREEKIGLDKLIFHEEKNIERFRVVAGQMAKAAPLVSCLTLTSGILSTVGYYGYRTQPVTNTRLGGTGDILTISAEGVALLATPAAAFRTYHYEQNLRKNGVHPDQLLSTRLGDLKTLESLLSKELEPGGGSGTISP